MVDTDIYIYTHKSPYRFECALSNTYLIIPNRRHWMEKQKRCLVRFHESLLVVQHIIMAGRTFPSCSERFWCITIYGTYRLVRAGIRDIRFPLTILLCTGKIVPCQRLSRACDISTLPPTNNIACNYFSLGWGWLALGSIDSVHLTNYSLLLQQ